MKKKILKGVLFHRDPLILAKLESQEKALKEAREMLMEFEWCAEWQGSGIHYCFICKSVADNGHKPGCRLRRFLER